MKTTKLMISVLGAALAVIGLSTFAAQTNADYIPSSYSVQSSSQKNTQYKTQTSENQNKDQIKNQNQTSQTQADPFQTQNYDQFRTQFKKDNVLKSIDTKDEFTQLLNLKKALESGDYKTALNIAKKLNITIDDQLMQKLQIKKELRQTITTKIQTLKQSSIKISDRNR